MKINDFKIGTAARPERLRFKGSSREGIRFMTEKLQIDPEQIKREIHQGEGTSTVYRVRRDKKRHR
jgi:hypothetical protein